MNAMDNPKEREEMRKVVQEFVLPVHIIKITVDTQCPGQGQGDLLIDVLIEELDKLRTKAPAENATADPEPVALPKAMLSQPMAGKTDEEITATREKAIADLQAQGYQVVNTLFTDEWYSKEAMASRGVVQVPLCFLAKSLENMSLCHAAYFCKGWEKARGCRIEHEAAIAYGLEILYEQ